MKSWMEDVWYRPILHSWWRLHHGITPMQLINIQKRYNMAVAMQKFSLLERVDEILRVSSAMYSVDYVSRSSWIRLSKVFNVRLPSIAPLPKEGHCTTLLPDYAC